MTLYLYTDNKYRFELILICIICLAFPQDRRAASRVLISQTITKKNVHLNIEESLRFILSCSLSRCQYLHEIFTKVF